MSILLKNIIDSILDKTKYSYANKEKVKDIFTNIDKDTSLDDLYKKYLDTKKYLEQIKNSKNTCKSDYSYWGYVSEEETYRLVERIYAEFLFSKINIEDLVELKSMQLKSLELDKIKKQIKDEIDGLTKYKPSNYKSKIELLESLLNGGNK